MVEQPRIITMALGPTFHIHEPVVGIYHCQQNDTKVSFVVVVDLVTFCQLHNCDVFSVEGTKCVVKIPPGRKPVSDSSPLSGSSGTLYNIPKLGYYGPANLGYNKGYSTICSPEAATMRAVGIT